jgi:hypothetical protein
VSAAEDFVARCLALVADRYPTTVSIEDRLAAVFEMVEAAATEQERIESAVALAEDALREELSTEHTTELEEWRKDLAAAESKCEGWLNPNTLTVADAQRHLRDAIMREAEVVSRSASEVAIAAARHEGVMAERKRVQDAEIALANNRKEKRARAKLAKAGEVSS